MDVTEAMLQRAVAKGACVEGLPKVGTALEDLTEEQLIFAHENNLLSLQEEEELTDLTGVANPPLWALSGSGYGYGYGYGDGDV